MGARDVRAGSAYVEVMTKDSTDKGLSGIKNKLTALGSKLKFIGGLATGGAAAAATATVMKAVQTGAAIQDLSNRYGIQTDAIQALSFAAEQSGTSIDAVVTGIKNLQKGIGNGTLGDQLNQLGLTMEQLRGKSPEQQLAMLATAFGNIADQEKKMALALKLFGKGGADLIPLLNGGADGAAALTDAFKAMGVTMSAEAVAEAAKLDDELSKLGTQFDAIVVKTGGSLMPTLEKLANVLDRFAQPALPTDANGNVTIGTRKMAKRTKEQLAEDWRASLQAEGGYDNTSSPMGRFLAEMQARAAGMNQNVRDREQAGVFREGFNVFEGIRKEWERIGRGVERNQNKERIRERRQIQADLKDVNQQISDAMDKSISFGSFDKRDLLGGVFNDIQKDQLKELRESKKLLERLLAKKGGLPVGM